MTKEEMTVHKALCDIKLLNKKIFKEISEIKFVVANKSTNNKVDGQTLEEFKQSIKSDYQSINSNIDRYKALTRAVAQSNAVTKIVVNGSEYTVAEAIAIKNKLIPIKQQLLDRILYVYNKENSLVKEKNERLEYEADEFVRDKDLKKEDSKNLAETILKTRNDYYNTRKYELVDPLKVNNITKELKDEIDSFLLDIDSALSVSNANTLITIEY